MRLLTHVDEEVISGLGEAVAHGTISTKEFAERMAGSVLDKLDPRLEFLRAN